MSTKDEPMPPEVRKLARLAVATVLATKMLNRDDIATCTYNGDPAELGRLAEFISTLSTSLASKLVEKSGL